MVRFGFKAKKPNPTGPIANGSLHDQGTGCLVWLCRFFGGRHDRWLWRLTGKVRGLETLSVCVDVSLVVTTVCGTVCVEACMVCGHGSLFACVDFSLVSTPGGCTESVIVVASTVATMGWAVSSVCVSVSTTRVLGFWGGDGGASLLGAGRLKGWWSWCCCSNIAVSARWPVQLASVPFWCVWPFL